MEQWWKKLDFLALVHSYCYFFLHISDKYTAFRTLFVKQQKEEKATIVNVYLVSLSRVIRKQQ